MSRFLAVILLIIATHLTAVVNAQEHTFPTDEEVERIVEQGNRPEIKPSLDKPCGDGWYSAQINTPVCGFMGDFPFWSKPGLYSCHWTGENCDQKSCVFLGCKKGP